MEYLFFFLCDDNGYANAPLLCVILTLPVLLLVKCDTHKLYIFWLIIKQYNFLYVRPATQQRNRWMVLIETGQCPNLHVDWASCQV